MSQTPSFRMYSPYFSCIYNVFELIGQSIIISITDHKLNLWLTHLFNKMEGRENFDWRSSMNSKCLSRLLVQTIAFLFWTRTQYFAPLYALIVRNFRSSYTIYIYIYIYIYIFNYFLSGGVVVSISVVQSFISGLVLVDPNWKCAANTL